MSRLKGNFLLFAHTPRKPSAQPDPYWSDQDSLTQIEMNMTVHQTKLLRPKMTTAVKGFISPNIRPATCGVPDW